jgi:hypothetical protein
MQMAIDFARIFSVIYLRVLVGECHHPFIPPFETIEPTANITRCISSSLAMTTISHFFTVFQLSVRRVQSQRRRRTNADEPGKKFDCKLCLFIKANVTIYKIINMVQKINVVECAEFDIFKSLNTITMALFFLTSGCLLCHVWDIDFSKVN